MKYAFAAFYEPADFPVAIFWDRGAAQIFAKTENDAVQAEVVLVEEIALVDAYGFPGRLTDLPIVAPWAARCPAIC